MRGSYRSCQGPCPAERAASGRRGVTVQTQRASIVKDKWSLNTLISLIVLGAGLLLLALYLSVSYSYQKSQFRHMSEQRLEEMGPRLTDITQRLLAIDADGLLEAEMQSMGRLAHIGLIVVVDDSNMIRYSSDTRLRGSQLDDTDFALAATLIGEGSGVANQVVSQLDEHRQLLGVFAYTVPGSTTGSQPPDSGHVVLNVELEESYQALRAALWSQALMMGLLLTAMAGLLWFMLQQIVMVPLRKVVQTTRAIAAGDFTVRTNLASTNELGEISATLDSLALSYQERSEVESMHRRLSQLVEDMVDEVIVCDMETFAIVDTNKATQAKLGYSAEELKGMVPWTFLSGRTRESMHEMLIPLFDGSVSHIDCECRHICKDGSMYPVRARMQIMAHQSPPVLVCICQDMSELQQQTESVQLRERALAAVSEGIIIGHANADNEQRTIVYVNQAVCDMSGYSVEELMGQSTDMLRKNAENQPGLMVVKTALKNAESVQVQLDATRKDGTPYKTEVTISPVFNAEGDVTHFIGIHRDITQRLLTEEKLHQAQKIRAIGQLSGGLAHDFNNLLSVIVGNLELLRASTPEATQLARIDGAENAAHMGAHLTRRLLSFASQQRLVPAVTNVNDHINNAMALLAPTIGETIRLTDELEADLWATLTDPGEIETAVINLTINARDAMSQGGAITIKTANIVLAKEEIERKRLDLEPGEYVRFCVMDNGPGICKTIQERIFEPFFTTKLDSEGSGLGLASVFGFAKQSGGCVQVKSDEGEGTVVSVYLPRHVLESDVFHSVNYPVDDENHCFKGSTILVVEDKEMVRSLTVQQLQALGFDALEVENGVSAIELLRTSVAVDVVLTDVVMPGGVCGYDVAKWVQTHRPECRILMTSGFNAPAEWEGESDVTGLQFLHKPYRLNDLRKALQDVMECHESEAVEF